MYDSGFDQLIGCVSNGTNNEESSSLMNLSPRQCAIVHFSEAYVLCFGLIGCIAHSYIIFCYHFRHYESRTPVEVLIVCLSLYDLSCCFGLCLGFVIAMLPNFTTSYSCPAYFHLVSFYRDSVYLVVLLLAANRFYSVCKPRRYGKLFSKNRIRFYTFLIYLTGTTVALSNDVTYCVVGGDDLFYNTNRIYQIITSAIYVFFYLPTIIATVYFYLRIRTHLKQQIRDDEIFSRSVRGRRSLLPSTSGSTSFESSVEVLGYEIRLEKSYLKAITISTLSTLPLVITDFVVSVTTELFEIKERTVIGDDNMQVLFTLEMFLQILFSFLYVINPIVFYVANEDFRIKLRRPIRAIRARFRPSSRMAIARLNTYN